MRLLLSTVGFFLFSYSFIYSYVPREDCRSWYVRGLNRIESSLFIRLFKDSQAFRVFTGTEPEESSDKGGGESLPTQKREKIYVNFIDANAGKHLYV